MRKKKKFALLIMILATFGLTTAIAFADDSVLDSNFSQIVNVNNNGTYSKDIYLQTINNAISYNVANEYKNIYGETVDTSRSNSSFKERDNYGFKVNGEFYTSGVVLSEDGFYHVEGYYFEYVNDIKVPTTKINFEDFTIEIKKNDEIILNNNTFYYQNYDNADDLINDIEKSFSKTININVSSQNQIINAYKNMVNNSIKETKILNITIKEVNNSFTIYLKSIDETGTIEELDIDEITKNVEPVVVNVAKYSDYIGKTISLIEDLESELLLVLDVPEPHSITIEVLNEPKLTSYSKSTLSDVKYIEYEIYDRTFKHSYTYSRPFYIYNSNKFTDNDAPKVEFYENIVLDLNSNFKFQDFVESVYDSVFNQKSYSNVEKITYDFSNIQVSVPGNYKISVTVSDYSENQKTYSTTVKVVSNSAPKILQKYSKIYIKRGLNIYDDQIMVIDDVTPQDELKVSMEILDSDESGGIIRVIATDTDNHVVTKDIPFEWEPELSFYDKFIEYPLYKIKRFFQNLF